MQTKEKKGLDSIRVSAYSVVGYFGFSALIASILLLLGIIPDLYSQESLSAPEIRITLSLVLIASFGVMFLCSYRIVQGKCIVLFTGSIIGFVGVGLLVFNVFPEVLFFELILIAIGLASSLSLWFCFVFTQTHKSIFMFLSASIALAVFLCLVGEYLDPPATQGLTLAVFFVAVACVSYLFKSKPKTYSPTLVSNKDSDKRSKIPWTAAIMLAFNYFAFGFVVSVASGKGIRFLCLGVVLCASLVMLFDFLGKKVLSERSVAPFTIPLTVLGFAPLFVFGELGERISLCALSTIFVLYLIFGWGALAESARISNLSLLRIFSKARVIDYIGLTAGLILGAYIVSVAEIDNHAAIQISIGIVVAYGFIAAICHRVRYPESGMDDTGEKSKGSKNLWRRRCRAVCEQFDLSERQQEVLMLIAQGRNARYVEEALTVSSSTAQTHIRNIYRKTGVHSRQELLNLIENTKLYGEE